MSPAEANAHVDTDMNEGVLPVAAPAVSEGVAPKPGTQRRSRGGRTVEAEVQDALDELGSLRYTDTSRRAAAGRAELLANFGRRGMGRIPRKCKLRGPSGVTVG